VTDAALQLQQFLQVLGLAKRAGRIRVGTDAVFAALAAGDARMVVVASDAGQNVQKKIRDKCAFYDRPLLRLADRSALGGACGRGQAVVVAVNDPGFAAKLMAYAEGISSGGVAFDETEGL
jgi:ribosomal protein L7Ae-like RNA K-turn-binding protein